MIYYVSLFSKSQCSDSVILCVLRLFFYKDTFFGWRRMALLCFFVLSAAVPLLNIQTWIVAQEPMVAIADLYANTVLPEFTIAPEIGYQLDKYNAEQYQYSLLGRGRNSVYTFSLAVDRYYPSVMSMPYFENRKYKCTFVTQRTRTILFLPMDFY